MRALRRSWDRLGREDAMWAVLTDPNKRGRRWEPEEFFATGEVVVDRILDALAQLEVRPSGGSALDFGCGVGRLTQALARHFEHVVGVDIAPSMITAAREYNRYEDRVTYIQNERSDLAVVGDRRFDLIISSITLQHMDPVLSKGYIAEFLGLLAPGGVAVFDLPVPVGRQRLKMAAPYAARRVYELLTVLPRPRMQMFGVEEAEIVELINRGGAKVLDITPSDAANQPGRQYVVQMPT